MNQQAVGKSQHFHRVKRRLWLVACSIFGHKKNWSTFRSQPHLSKPYSMTCPITFQYILSIIMYTPSTSSGLVVKTRQIAWLNAAARCHPQAPFLTASATPSSAKVALKFQLELVDWPWGKHTKHVASIILLVFV